MKSTLALLVMMIMVSVGQAQNFWVAVEGNDKNDGSKEKPFATLQQAQQAARTAQKPTTINLRGGVYYLPETLVLSAADSGTIWQAHEKEVPVISGGAKLELTWQAGQNGIYEAKIPAGLTSDQLFINGIRQHMARYPNYDPAAQFYNGYAPDCISPQRAAKWADPTDGFIHAMHKAMWGDYHYRITGKDEKNNLKYIGGWQNNRQMGMHGKYRFVENIFEELDAPGEWFLNTKAGLLYFYPPAGMDIGKARVEAVRLRHLVEFRGDEKHPVKGVIMKGIQFCHAARTFMDNKEPLLRSDWTTYRGGAVFIDGAEDCTLENCLWDQVGGNAVFINNYNRRITIRGCEIVQAGDNGIAFVGDPKAVRNPLFEYGQRIHVSKIDRTPGPKTNNYPAECLVEDCLIHETGRVEKQTSPVQISMAKDITVRHCSIYDVPRAGINIGDGCWGGHVIEFCDVFDTVKETGDHGSFNSWGRDRFWGVGGLNLNDDKTWEAEKELPLLDTVKTIILRNNRWRCDHGWDIDLDDGSSNYQIINNVCLHGGLKNREGFYRVVENNIMVNNGFHPHVWYKHSQDIVRRNIMGTEQYLPAGGMPSTPWGRELDYNFIHKAGATDVKPAAKLAQQSRRDANSIISDAQFVDAAHGDFRVKDTSPALKVGFKNFPMDQFGVINPELKAKARTPRLGNQAISPPSRSNITSHYWSGLKIKELEGQEFSAYGVSKDSGGVVVLSGMHPVLQIGDVIQSLNNQPVKSFQELLRLQNLAAGKPLEMSIVRKQMTKVVTVSAYVFAARETGTPAAGTTPIRAITTQPIVQNEKVEALNDGKLAENQGPIFANNVIGGIYKIDLGTNIEIGDIKTWSFNHGNTRGVQKFVLFGSTASEDPGWDPTKYTAIIEVDTTGQAVEKFNCTTIKASADAAVGKYRWLIWVVSPVTASGENTAYQELQIRAKAGR